ncbi:MAG: trypsin-like peptidase domain-containing protein [Planctomycetaceae bacterium]
MKALFLLTAGLPECRPGVYHTGMSQSLQNYRNGLPLGLVLRGFVCWLAFNSVTRAQLSDESLQQAQAFESTLIAAIRAAEPSVVSIARVPSARLNGLTSPPARFPALASGELGTSFVATDFGSGVILSGAADDENRYVLTAAHVVFGRRSYSDPGDPETLAKTDLYVRLASRHILPAELIAADQRSDLAVLRLPLLDSGIPIESAPPIAMGDGVPLVKGRLVVALGNPYAIARDGSASASIGIVSNVSRRPWPPRGVLSDPTEEDLTIHHYGTLLQVDTRLNLGASGGALVDLQGRLVGLTTAMAALEGYEKSVGYAVPIDHAAIHIIESLQQGYEVEYGFLGIQPGEADAQQLAPFRQLTTQASAARVRRVAPGSPAELGSLRVNDIVLKVGETPVYSDLDLVREVGWLGPDVVAKLSVLRPDENRVLEVECRLGKWPVYDESLSIVTRERQPVWRGLHIDYATARKRYLPANPLLAFPTGVVVTRVDPDTPAAKAGLAEGLFIVEAAGRSIGSPADFQSVITDATGDVVLKLSNGSSVTVAAGG